MMLSVVIQEVIDNLICSYGPTTRAHTGRGRGQRQGGRELRMEVDGDIQVWYHTTYV